MRRILSIVFIGWVVMGAVPAAVHAEDVRVAAWYGSSTFVYSSTLLDVVSFLNDSNTVRGGSSFGIDFWLGSRLQYGIGTAYIPEFASDFSTSFTVLFVTINTNVTSSMSDVPMLFQIRYFPVPRWFIGGGAGILGFSTKVTGSASLWFVPLVGGSGGEQDYQFGFEGMTGMTLLEDKYGRLDFTVRAYTSWPFVKDFRMDLVPALTLSLGY